VNLRSSCESQNYTCFAKGKQAAVAKPESAAFSQIKVRELSTMTHHRLQKLAVYQPTLLYFKTCPSRYNLIKLFALAIMSREIL